MSGGGGGGGKRDVPHIDLVPILDGMTAVIFFLILSSVFLEYTKLTLPPSKTNLVSANDPKNPLAPKLFAIVRSSEKIEIVLTWQGDNAGYDRKEVFRTDAKKKSLEIENAVKDMIAEFAKKYPNEKSIQMGISRTGTYQELISMMDGVRTNIQDIVLISPTEESLIGNRL